MQLLWKDCALSEEICSVGMFSGPQLSRDMGNESSVMNQSQTVCGAAFFKMVLFLKAFYLAVKHTTLGIAFASTSLCLLNNPYCPSCLAKAAGPIGIYA